MRGTVDPPKDYQAMPTKATISYMVHKYGLTTAFLHATVLCDNHFYSGQPRYVIEMTTLEESERQWQITKNDAKK